jgi:aldose 1-epimerase
LFIMTAMLKPFGKLADGRPVQLATLHRPGGLTVEVLDYGAAVRSLRVPTPTGPVEAVLGFPRIEDYEADAGYQGVVIGRYANRIAGARFVIDGEVFRVTANEGANCLHGGRPGFDKRLWRFEEVTGETATLSYRSPKGEEGFPGGVAAFVRLALTADDTLEIVWQARSTRPTPVNLTHHLYFNLSGRRGGDVLEHELRIDAAAMTPVRPDLIPTGALAPVAGTAFDLRAPRSLGAVLAQPDPQLAIGGGIDHNWALEPGDGPQIGLRSPETGLTLSVTTDQPGVQVYAGQGLKPPFAPYGGVALEPQNFPDAMNQPGFPEAILRPEELYRRRAAYRFQVDA